MMEQPNILFIVVDALRPKNLSCYGYPKPTSPNIDNLAKEGILFENAFSCAPSTYPSLTSIFSGSYPSFHGITSHIEPATMSSRGIERLNESGAIFLPEILKSEGYATLAVDWLGRWLKRGYDYYSGIIAPNRLKIYRLLEKLMVESLRTRHMRKIRDFLIQQQIRFSTFDKLSLTARSLTDCRLHGKDICDKVINLLKRVHDKKFFLFVHYWDTHAPYHCPKRYVKKFIDTDYGNDQSVEELLSQFKPLKSWCVGRKIGHGVRSIKEVLARYDAAIAYIDHQIGRLIETLENYGILDNTFIILTSDHGESLTEHEIYFSHHGLYDVTTNVALILRFPGFPKNRRIKSLIQHTDVIPTIFDILGIQVLGSDMDGKSAVPLIHNELDELRDAVLLEEADSERKRAIRTNKYKYIFALSREEAVCKECECIHGGIEELYNLNKDPQETDNVLEGYPNEAKILKEELSKWIQLLESKKKKKRVRKIKKADIFFPAEEEKLIAERLRELGYF